MSADMIAVMAAQLKHVDNKPYCYKAYSCAHA